MTVETRERIADLLGRVTSPGTFTARRTAEADDLRLEVEGLGRLRFPVPEEQARGLCEIARPARYGQGERTLLDRDVRDTWEVPRELVWIDRERWERTLLPVLDELRAELGLPDGRELRPELHSMLVYAPGQFFLPHQDSEKDDEMVGTLVVTLPSPYKGGVFVVEHRGETVRYRAPRKPLSFVAFYADCRHEVRPVTEGYRVVLTYNLMLAPGEVGPGAGATMSPQGAAGSLAEGLREHFETPLPPRWSFRDDAPEREPPGRLVYLLDHEYTERGLGWDRLKGDDAPRAALLREAAGRADCETVLALAEVHEVWGCMEPDWRSRGRRHRRWSRGEEGEWYEEPPADDPDDYTLVDLHDQNVALSHWIEPSGREAEPVSTRVDGEEVCATTPSHELEPYATEYEGFMGNYGNTMDRWYRRAAVVVWPREGAFAVRAEASPAWAVESLLERVRAGHVAEARELVAQLRPFWDRAVVEEPGTGFAEAALRAAEGLDDPELAAFLLGPLRVETLTPEQAAALVALTRRYGEHWLRAVLFDGSDRHLPSMPEPDRLAWLAALPRLCEALRATDESVGTAAARAILEDQWSRLASDLERARDLLIPPHRRDGALADLPEPLLGLLRGSAVAEAAGVRDRVVAFLCAGDAAAAVPLLVQVLRQAAPTADAAAAAVPGLDDLRRHCAEVLRRRLEEPAREPGNWSIEPPDDCDCELCDTLAGFLTDPDRRHLEWPLNKDRRKHVHRRLDRHDLPVRHETRRSGRPYTLELTKTEALFEREAAARRAWRADLDWLVGEGER